MAIASGKRVTAREAALILGVSEKELEGVDQSCQIIVRYRLMPNLCSYDLESLYAFRQGGPGRMLKGAGELPLTEEAPPNIRCISGLLDIADFQLPSGIYFLYWRYSLQYIGKSLDPASRLAQHRRNGKAFDQAFLLPVNESLLSVTEQALIRHFRPPLNDAVALVGMAGDARILSRLGIKIVLEEAWQD